ncbi:MAG: SCO4848 family membrane protein [Jatrophihabitantaceae bacterium]
MVLSKRISAFLVLFGVWSWLIWPTFLHNIWRDPRSWQDGPTAFFGVHAVLTAVSLLLGTAVGVLGVLGWRAAARHHANSGQPASANSGRPSAEEQPSSR